MRYLLFAMLLVFCMMADITNAFATTATWQRSPEADVHHYNIYTCPLPGCIVQKVPSQKRSFSIPQTLVGVNPSKSSTAFGIGTIAVTAVDASGNESGLSNQVALPNPDKTSPDAPLNLRVQ